MIGISKEFCVDDVMLNCCLLLFTIMCSKSEGRLLGQGLSWNLFYYLHINYAIAVLSFHSAWLIVFVFQKWCEMSVGWNVFGAKYHVTLWFLVTGFEHFSKGLASPHSKYTWNLTRDSFSWIKLYSQSCKSSQTHSGRLQGGVTTKEIK